MGDFNIDSLEIKIQSDSNNAINAINRLKNALSSLNSSLSLNNVTVFENQLAQTSNSINRLSNSLAKIDASKIRELSSALRTLSNKNSQSAANNISILANSLQKLDKKIPNLVGLESLAKSISKLGNANAKNAASNLAIISPALKNFVISLNGMQINAQTGALGSLISSLSKFGNTNMTQSADNLNVMSASLRRFITTLNSMPDNVAQQLQQLSALGNIQNNSNMIRIINSNSSRNFNGGLSSSTILTNAMREIGNSAKNLGSKGVNLVKKFFSSFVNGSKKSSKASDVLASKIGLFYAKFFMVIRAVKLLWKSVESAMDTIEVVNYFNAALSQVTKSINLNDFKKAGYDSASAYANSFRKTLLNLNEKMTGYQLNEAGNLFSSGAKNLGLDPVKVLNYESMYAQMANSIGVSASDSVKISRALTEIGADLASVKNMKFEQVWENMASGLTGMSRSVDKYGINIRDAALQTELNRLGIETTVRKLSQADKAMLRTIVILKSSKYAWGDLANTISAPANQLRVLQAQLSALGRAIGNIILPVFAKLLPIINQIVYALRELAEWIVKILGFQDFDWGNASGADNSALSDLLDTTEDEADALNDATTQAKKFKKQLQGFDELNNLTSSDSKDKLPDALTSSLLSGALNDALNKYQKAWDKAFKNMTNSFNGLSNAIKKAYKKDGLFGVGRYISNALADQLNSIPWNKVYEGARKFGKGLADFLNGLISPKLFSAVGKTIASSLNTVLHFLDSFGYNFNWENFGTSLGAGLNTYMKTIQWPVAMSAAKNWGKGIATALNSFLNKTDFILLGRTVARFVTTGVNFWYHFVTTFNFKQLGQKIADSINGFFKEMNKFDPDTRLTGWQKLGKSISRSITGILDTLITALEGINWERVGQAIGTLIASIDWGKIVWGLFGLAKSLFKAIVNVIKGWAQTDPLSLAIVFLIVRAIMNIKAAQFIARISGRTLGGVLMSAISRKLSVQSLSTASTGQIWGNIGGAIAGDVAGMKAATSSASFISKIGKFAGAFGKCLITAVVGFNVGKKIGEVVAKSIGDNASAEYYKNFSWSEFFGDVKYWWENMAGDWVSGLLKGIANGFNGILNWLSNNVFSPIVNGIKFLFGIHSPSKVMYGYGQMIGQGLLNGFGSIFTNIGNWINTNIVQPIINGLSNLAKMFFNIGSNIMNSLLKGISSLRKSLISYVTKVRNSAVNVFRNVKTTFTRRGQWIIQGIRNGARNALPNLKKFLSKAKTQCINLFNGLKSALFPKGENIMKGIRSGSVSYWPNTRTFLAKARKSAVKIYDGLKASLFPKGENIMKGIKSGSQNMWPSLRKQLSSFRQKSVSIFNGLTSSLHPKGKNIVKGLISGVNNQKGKLQSLLLTMKSNMLSAFSPTGFKQAAINICNALAQGFNKAGSFVYSAVNAIANGVSSVFSGISNWVNSLFNGGYVETNNKKYGNNSKNLSTLFSSTGGTITAYGKRNYPNKLASGGIVTKDGIKRFAAGGIPNTGTLFWAGERGSEIVANAPHGTEVLNQSQIAQSIAVGVENANSSQNALIAQQNRLLQEQNALLREINSQGMTVSANQIFNAVRKSDAHYKKVNGHSAFI